MKPTRAQAKAEKTLRDLGVTVTFSPAPGVPHDHAVAVPGCFRCLMVDSAARVNHSYLDNPSACPDAPHRGPEGPNEDISQCGRCWSPSWSKRPAGETFGGHLPDCSLPLGHESYCVPGGAGHPDATVIRG